MSSNTKWRKFIKSPMRDLGLQVGEKTYWVSRRRLADISPMFKTLFYGELQKLNVEIVELSGKEPRDILEMLRCLFPTRGQGDTTKPITDENIESLLKLGTEYGIGKLTEKCSEFLTWKIFFGGSIEEIVDLIKQANRYRLKDAVRVGLRKLSEVEPSKLLKEASFNDLPWNMHLAIALIAWFRGSRPPSSHEYSTDGKDHAGYKRCRQCGYEACDFQNCCLHFWTGDKEPECDSICPTCKMEYGSGGTDFVCKCVDPLIRAELEKWGL